MSPSEMEASFVYSDEQFDSKRPTIDLGLSRLTAEDAVKCLQGQFNVIVPTPNARPCNNLDEYFHKSTINARRTPKNGHNDSTLSSSSSSSYRLKSSKKPPTKPSEPFAVPLVRNFERILKKSNLEGGASPSIQPPRPKKARPDLFTKTDQIESHSGPISHLKKRINQVVKVMIRRRKNVPYVSRVIEYKGTLCIFDKHMNMYLKNVVEMFKYERNGKVYQRGRLRDGIILRGDNVILVV